MTNADKPEPLRRIAWISGNMDFGIASARYRMIYPAAMLQKLGWDNIVTAAPDSLIKRLPELDAIVIVKRLDPGIIRIVCEANDAGVPVLLDLCDDVLDQDYRSTGHDMFRLVFDAIAPRLAALVTTGTYLKRRFETYGFAGPILIIPDCVETPALSDLGQNFLKRTKQVGATPVARAVPLIRRKIGSARDFFVRVYSAVRHPRRSALDLRHTLRTILHGDGSAKILNAEAAQQDPYFLEALNEKRRTLIWFGNHGGPHSDFGMTTLVRIGKELRDAHARSPFVLIVVSNDHEKWKHLIEPIGVPTRFVPWSHEGTQVLLKKARAFIMPTGEDSFSLGKSANRVTLALEQNTPVICEPLESLDWMDSGLHQNGLTDAIVACLEDRQTEVAKAAQLRKAAHEQFGISRIAEKWQKAVDEAQPYRRKRGRYGALTLPEKLLILVNNATDRPIAMAVLDSAHRHGIETGVVVSLEACHRNPRLAEDLIARRISPTFVQRGDARRKDYRWLRNASALFCPSESSLPAHAVPHWLTKLANEAGLRTYTAQHGLSNVGLTDTSTTNVRIASQTIFTWNDPDLLPDWVEPSLRARCTGIGRIEDPLIRTLASGRAFDRKPERVGIFENLHWQVFPDSFREVFKQTVLNLAENNPGTEFLIYPHPAGLWSVKFFKTNNFPPNLWIVNPARRENLGQIGSAALAGLDRVLTTPSSVAVDAALIGVPTIIISPPEFDLSLYAGLKSVCTTQEASAALFETTLPDLKSGMKAFLDKAMIGVPDAADQAVSLMFPGAQQGAAGSQMSRWRVYPGESL